jgi:mRNA interferase MazF
MLFEPGELVLLAFPFSSGDVVKQRPALVLLDTGDLDLLVARVTTQVHESLHDVPIHDWKQAGLLAASTVRIHKLATLEKSRVQRKLGRLSPRDLAAVRAVVQKMLGKI